MSSNMCSISEFYNIDTEECQKCSECPNGDSVMFKCSAFVDTICKKEFWKDLPVPPHPVPTPSYVTPRPGTVAVEVLPEDWTSSPTVLMVATALFLTVLTVVLATIIYCLWRRVWRASKDKEILYLPRRYTDVHDMDGEEPRYQPLPSRERLKKTNYIGSSIYANSTIPSMPNTHIYVNMLDLIDNDYCNIDDYVNLD